MYSPSYLKTIVEQGIYKYIEENTSKQCTLSVKKIAFFIYREYKIDLMGKPGANIIRRVLNDIAVRQNWHVYYVKDRKRWIVIKSR